MMTDLKPCPFCGGGETRFDDTQNWTGMRYQHVCTTIRHFCQRPADDEFVQAVITLRGRNKDDCTRRWNIQWNTRATDRDAILEEAARVADEIADQQRKMKARGAISVEAADESIGSCDDIAAAIRALKGGGG